VIEVVVDQKLVFDQRQALLLVLQMVKDL